MLTAIGIRTTLEINTKAGKKKTILGVATVTRSDVYSICIGTRENVLAFAHKVGLGTDRKASLLQEMVRLLSVREIDLEIPLLLLKHNNLSAACQ